MALLREAGRLVQQSPTLPPLLLAALGTSALIKRTQEGRQVFFPLHTYPWIKQLEANWRVLREELDAVLLRETDIPPIREIHEVLSSNSQWRAFIFCGFGQWFERNVQACPRTAALLRQIPELQSAFFSVFPPGMHLEPHEGLYNGLLRYQLALKVPKDKEGCALRIGEHTVHWEEGKSLPFDDTFQHEAWNRTSETRVVLFLDVLRPLPVPLDRANKFIVERIGNTDDLRRVMPENLARWYAALDGRSS